MNLAKLADKLLTDQVDRYHRNTKWNIEYHTERAAEYAKKLSPPTTELKEKVARYLEAVKALRSARVKHERNDACLTLTVRTRKGRVFGRIRKALGRLDVASKTVEPVKDKNGLVEVSITPERWPFVEVKFRHRLRKTDPCHLVPETTYRVVCERKTGA